MTLKDVLLKPIKLIGGGVLDLKGFRKNIIDKEVGGSEDEYNVADGMFYIPGTFSEEDIAEIQKIINSIINNVGVTVDDTFSIEIGQISQSSNVFNNKEIIYDGFKGFYAGTDATFMWANQDDSGEEYNSIEKLVSPLYYKNK